MKIEYTQDEIIYLYDFWDCDCEENFTHRKSEVKQCPICKSRHDDCPDARLYEMLIYNPNMMTERERELAVVVLLMANPNNHKLYAQRVLDSVVNGFEDKLVVWNGRSEFGCVHSRNLEVK